VEKKGDTKRGLMVRGTRKSDKIKGRRGENKNCFKRAGCLPVGEFGVRAGKKDPENPEP